MNLQFVYADFTLYLNYNFLCSFPQIKNTKLLKPAEQMSPWQVLPFLLRRMKEDVLHDLPPKIIQDHYCTLTPLQVSGHSDKRFILNALI